MAALDGSEFARHLLLMKTILIMTLLTLGLSGCNDNGCHQWYSFCVIQ